MVCLILKETAQLFSEVVVTFLYPHHPCMRVADAPHPRQHFVVILAVLVGFVMVSHFVCLCISPVATNAEHFFMC